MLGKMGKRRYGLRFGFIDQKASDEFEIRGRRHSDWNVSHAGPPDAGGHCGSCWARSLELRPQKTKILHNIESRRPRKIPEYTIVNNLNIEILPYSGSQKYLGRQFTFDKQACVEIDARIKAAWKKFWSFKDEFRSRSYSLRDKFRLFNGTVTPTMLYGCASWTMTVPLERRVRTTQRQMMRIILGSPRKRLKVDDGDAGLDTNASSSNDLEPWVDWIQRTTHISERVFANCGYEDWVSTQYKRKLDWAQRVSKGSPHKWTYKALFWDPDVTNNAAQRRPHGPRRRWTDKTLL